MFQRGFDGHYPNGHQLDQSGGAALRASYMHWANCFSKALFCSFRVVFIRFHSWLIIGIDWLFLDLLMFFIVVFLYSLSILSVFLSVVKACFFTHFIVEVVFGCDEQGCGSIFQDLPMRMSFNCSSGICD